MSEIKFKGSGKHRQTAVGQTPQGENVNDVSQELLPRNDKRVGLIAGNSGVLDAFGAWDVDAEVGKGIFLPKGQVVVLTDGAVSRGPFSVITGMGTNVDVTLQEMNRE
ncbi:MAG: hypothetical protein V3V08_23265 [Nannocystaceae bacterium]